MEMLLSLLESFFIINFMCDVNNALHIFAHVGQCMKKKNPPSAPYLVRFVALMV